MSVGRRAQGTSQGHLWVAEHPSPRKGVSPGESNAWRLEETSLWLIFTSLAFTWSSTVGGDRPF